MVGEALSLADITVGTALYRYFNLEAYYVRLRARPAYAGYVMVPFDQLFGRVGF